MSGWLQKYLSSPGGVGQLISVAETGMTLAVGMTEDRGLFLKVYIFPTVGGIDVAIEGRLTGAWSGSSSVYGRNVVARLPATFDLFVEGTTALDTYPPNFTNPVGALPFGTIALASATSQAGQVLNYYLEWWGNMVSDFGKKVKAELDTATWTNAGSAPDGIFLVLDPNMKRDDLEAAFGDSLALVHQVTEATPEDGFAGGFGRKGRKLTCLITVFVRAGAGINSSKEQGDLETLDLYLEDVMHTFDPAGVPNLLDGFCYFTRTTPEGSVVDMTLSGINAVARSVRVDGYKIEAT